MKGTPPTLGGSGAVEGSHNNRTNCLAYPLALHVYLTQQWPLPLLRVRVPCTG